MNHHRRRPMTAMFHRPLRRMTTATIRHRPHPMVAMAPNLRRHRPMVETEPSRHRRRPTVETALNLRLRRPMEAMNPLRRPRMTVTVQATDHPKMAAATKYRSDSRNDTPNQQLIRGVFFSLRILF